MKSIILLGLLISTSVFAQAVISEKSDDKFGGYYLEVQKSQENLSNDWSRPVGIRDVLSIQKLMRDCLQLKSRSYFRKLQAAYLEACLKEASKKTRDNVLVINRLEKGLTVVFDIDETLLTQWHIISRDNPERTTFIAKHLDETISEKDNVSYVAPTGVTVRPGSIQILISLLKNANISKIYFFTAREDKSANELTNYFLSKVPTLKNKFGGFFARNYLRLDSTTTTPSKDLRIVTPNLERIILIDDNPQRVIQKELNFSIPKFNADLYLEAIDSHDTDVLEANNGVLPFVKVLINEMANSRNVPDAFYPYSTKNAEEKKLDWNKKILRSIGFNIEAAKALIDKKIFHQEWIPGKIINM